MMPAGARDTMTSRERVLRAFEKMPADRVPLDYQANPGIDARLKRHFGLSADDMEGLLCALGVDFRSITAPYRGPRIHADVPGRNVDPLWGIRTRWIAHSTGGYWEACDFPLRNADVEEVASWPLPDPGLFDYTGVAEACRRNDRYAQALICYGDLINGNGFFRGMEQTLIDLVTDDPAALLLADRRFEIQLAMAERILDAAKGRIDFLWLGEDLGTQDRPMVSMGIFRRHIRPRYQRFVDLARSYKARTMIHTCGSSSWAYDDFIEMGIDAVDTLQPECKDMSPAALVERFGGRLSFHGCISTAGPLAFGTPGDVRRVVKETLDIMMPGCSYMLAPTHEIQDNTPTENVVEMYRAARELGRYAGL
jgi:uroporphyrinogen decarboxylase